MNTLSPMRSQPPALNSTPTPADSRSDTGVGSTTPQYSGNKQLKSLLAFTCNSPIGTIAGSEGATRSTTRGE